jgi:shikimate dehydrogenase
MTARYAVIGDPIAHSLSPAIHTRWLADAGINATYTALRVHGPDPEALIRALPSEGLSGCNVTIPHKEAALRAADIKDPLALRIGAANTLRFTNGRIEAFNTDAAGFSLSLDAAAPHWRHGGGKACLLGAGGSARAAVAALDAAGFDEIAVANRTLARVAPLAECALKAKLTAFEWDDRTKAAAGAKLIINATSLGLNGKDPLDAPAENAAPNAIAFDLVYKPLHTHFLRSAESQGLQAVDGLGMLIYQAAAAFEIWFGQKPDAEAGRIAALAQLTGASK